MLLTAAGLTGSGAISVLALLIVAVGFIYVYVKASLAAPVIAIDKVHNPLTIITRSWRLTKGNSFRLFLFYFLLIVVYGVVSAVLSMVVAALGLALGASAAQLVNGLVSGVLGAIFSVVFVSVIAAVHRQLSGPSAEAVSQTFE